MATAHSAQRHFDHLMKSAPGGQRPGLEMLLGDVRGPVERRTGERWSVTLDPYYIGELLIDDQEEVIESDEHLVYLAAGVENHVFVECRLEQREGDFRDFSVQAVFNPTWAARSALRVQRRPVASMVFTPILVVFVDGVPGRGRFYRFTPLTDACDVTTLKVTGSGSFS